MTRAHDAVDDALEALFGDIEDEMPPTLRDPNAPTAGGREPRVTQWFLESELAGKDPHEVKSLVDGAVLRGCGDLFQETGGRSAFAVVLTPRMYGAILDHMRVTLERGYFEMQVSTGFLSSERVNIPVYLQVPCYTSDLRVTVVMYPTLEEMKASDSVMHSLSAAKAMAALGFGAEAFEE